MEELKEVSEVEIRNYNELENAFEKSAAVLRREYLNNLSGFYVSRPDKMLIEKKMSECTRFFNIEKIVYNKNESFVDKLTTIAKAAHVGNYSLVVMISSDGKNTNLWMGFVNKTSDISMTGVMADSLKGSIRGNFHGSQIQMVDNDSVNKKLEFMRKNSVVSAVSNVASFRDENQEVDRYIQGIEKMIDALHEEKYTLITIADPVSNNEKMIVQNSLEQLYSQLSGFASTQMSMNENSSIASSDQYSNSFAHTLGFNTSISQSHTNQTGWSTANSHTEGKTSNAAAAKIIGVSAGAAAGLAATGIGAPLGVVLGTIGCVTGAMVGAVGSITGSKNKADTSSQSESISLSDTSTVQEGRNASYTNTKTESISSSKTLGSGRTLSFTVQNKTVQCVLDAIDIQIKRIRECGSYGSFSACTYILSDDINTNMLASSLFNALISGEKSNVETTKVNSWGIENNDEDKINVQRIFDFLSKLTHPRFIDANTNMEVTPASLISGKELAIQLGFPKRSIQGVSVVYKVPFGRNVIRDDLIEKPLKIGRLYNLGQVDSEYIGLDINSLTSHMFITGSTGTGKSNTIYKLLEQITKIDSDIHFMVVEPAKGEYKHAFYKHPRIKTQVYGTNPKKTPLLRINPFAFPEDIHVLEHVDRLVEIMNVCWPMYAAMPAILKNAVIKAYEKCGWDITNSYIQGRKMEYPCFADVLECINEILETSAFSDDNKGDYTGALCTRVESLTTGMNGQIFINDELSDMELFDQNVIIDLSRIGSVETKSLIMGILVMKLQEYRMASQTKPNQFLKHIMVLEEAHNLLKKTSMEQSADAGNLVGKSVEMLTNAIAEMRTYGEGFFIVDQAPDLLDAAVIRNTNTKIVLRLPEGRDRELVGKSMALSDEQIVELSKLEKGCAAVYQNDWEEAVLCKFEQYHKDYRNVALDDELFEYKSTGRMLTQSDKKKNVLRALLDVAIDEGHKEEKDNLIMLEKNLSQLAINYNLKREIRRVLMDDKRHSLDEIAGIVTGLYDCKGAVEKARYAGNVEEWNDIILCNVDSGLRLMSNYYIDLFIQCVLLEQLRKNPDLKPYVEDWMRYTKEVR